MVDDTLLIFFSHTLKAGGDLPAHDIMIKVVEQGCQLEATFLHELRMDDTQVFGSRAWEGVADFFYFVAGFIILC